MTSRNSFLASMIENNKRRIWLWVLSALGFIVALPTATALNISRGMTSTNFYYEIYGEILGAQKIKEYLMERVEQILGLESGMCFLIAAFAVISAIQGFSYLYHRQKIDFYMGMPVKRSRRFFLIWLNGIIVYLVPYFVGILLSCLIAFLNDALSGEIFLEALHAYGIHFCFYLGIYHLTILAVMLTGNMVITCFGVAVFFLYEVMVRMIIQAYMGTFYRFYSSYAYESDPILSPFAILFRYIEDLEQSHANAQEVVSPFFTVVYLLAFAVVIGIIAYLCYLKRPAEAAGKAMAFSRPKPWIKIFIVVPVTLMAGTLVGDIVGYSPLRGEGKEGHILFSMAVVLIVTCCLMQVIYEFDMKGALHKKFHILIAAAITMMIFVVFKYDLTGYDSYIPKAEKVESVALVPPMDSYSYYGESYFNENLEYMSRYDYMKENMYLTDVGAVNKLLKKSIEAIGQMTSLNEIYTGENGEWYQLVVNYRMNNKREVIRQLYVNLEDEETLELLDRIESSEEFIAGAYLGASDILERAIANEDYQIGIAYGNGIYETKMERSDAKELLACYKDDIAKAGFLRQRETIPSGSLIVTVEKKMGSYTMTNQAEISIYPFFDECISYLKEKGYYMERFINPEDIDRIQVVNYNYEIAEKLEEEQQKEASLDAMDAPELLHAQAYTEAEAVVYKADETVDTRRYATYDDADQIAQISEMIYPGGWIYKGWHMDKEQDENYAVSVYFKPGNDRLRWDGDIGSYCFLVDEVPDFVVADTQYIE